MRRIRYGAGVVAGVLLVAAGVVLMVRDAKSTISPTSIVRGYFDALAVADAPQALAYGTVPPGPRTLLTSAVLAEQQRIAPLRKVQVTPVRQDGQRATVAVRYVLAFARQSVRVRESVGVHKTPAGWRLDAAVVRTQLEADGARQRESILGTPVPSRSVLLFPGAVPIRFDSPYLELAATDYVSFSSASVTHVDVQISPAGHAAVLAAVRAGLQRCLEASADPACPIPSERYIPGSFRGSLRGPFRQAQLLLDPDALVGTLIFQARAIVAGTWRQLNFHNVQVPGRGRIALNVRAVAYATAPLQLHWEPW